jgi:outer membrane lipoprotein-sorting protein
MKIRMHNRRLNFLLIIPLVITIVQTVSVQQAAAQYPGFTVIDRVTEFKNKFSTEAKTVQSIKSDFIQEKDLSVLEETILSEGHFWFKRENKVRIEYVKPFRYLLLMNGDQILVRDENKENRMNTKSNKLFQQVNRIIVDCVQGTILENKGFSNRLFQNETMELLEMTPLSQALKDFFETIVVLVEKKDYSVSSIDLREPGGDHTILRFTRKELNTKLNDEIFTH